MKRIIIASLTLILSISLLTGCNKKNETNMENNNITENNSNESDNNTNGEDSNKQLEEKSLFTQVIGKLKFYVTSLEYKDNKTKIKYIIINNGADDIILNKYTTKIVDKNGNKKNITIKSNNTLVPNKRRNIMFYVDGDLTKATSITFELVEE